MDEIDIANEQAQRQLDVALSYRKPVPDIFPVGYCHWCEEEFEEGSLKLFCDSDCSTRHSRYNNS